jgi:hypothetical protein
MRADRLYLLQPGSLDHRDVLALTRNGVEATPDAVDIGRTAPPESGILGCVAHRARILLALPDGSALSSAS